MLLIRSEVLLSRIGKSGEMTQQIQYILKDLDSDDPDVQDQAIKQLEQVGTQHAIVILAQCLKETQWRQAKDFDPNWRGPQGERPLGRNVYEPIAFLAAKALVHLVPNPPVQVDEQPITIKHIEKWEKWWDENQKLYTEGDTKV